MVRARSGAGTLGLALLCGLAGCGPSNDQIATSTLVSAPIAYALAMLALWGLYGLWHERIGSVGPRWPVFAGLALGFALVAAWALQSKHVSAELMVIAGFLGSAVSVATSMLVGRIGLGREALMREVGQTVVVVPALAVAVIYLPFVLAWVETGAAEQAGISLGVFAIGLGGTYVAGPLILGLMVETVFARARYRREQGC